MKHSLVLSSLLSLFLSPIQLVYLCMADTEAIRVLRIIFSWERVCESHWSIALSQSAMWCDLRLPNVHFNQNKNNFLINYGSYLKLKSMHTVKYCFSRKLRAQNEASILNEEAKYRQNTQNHRFRHFHIPTNGQQSTFPKKYEHTRE